MTFKINNSRTAAVSLDTFYMPIDSSTPHGVKMILINKRSGVAVVSQYNPSSEWTHWHPLPKFRPLTFEPYDEEDDMR